MPDTKITALTAISTVDPAVDVLPIVDVSDTTMAASGTTKKITSNQILGAGGTATLASATITGDLTVDTSTLKVTASTDTVTVGATTTDAKFRVVDASYNGLRIGFLPGTANYNLYDATVHEFRTANVTPQQLYTLQASSSVWYDGAGGTRMTLNSTGLGVGASPTSKLTIGTGSYSAAASGTTGMYTTASGLEMLSDSYFFGSRTGGVLMTLTAAGNVGIGVTPSAWGSPFKALQVSRAGLRGSTATTGLSFNTYSDGTNLRYIAAGLTALDYYQNSGSHVWQIAGVGANANDPITFTQAMTLDAVSSLHVNTTAYTGVAGGFINVLNGYNIVQNNTGSASNRNWQLATNGSSAGALDFTISSANNTFPNFAYRMQLTSAGAAYNTTGTWGTISDSRLKENISDARNYLADLLKLRVVKYSLKEEASAVATKLGLIAQEVEQVFPSLVEQSDVAYDGGDGIRTVKTSILVPMLLKAIQELAARVQTLETR